MKTRKIHKYGTEMACYIIAHLLRDSAPVEFWTCPDTGARCIRETRTKTTTEGWVDGLIDHYAARYRHEAFQKAREAARASYSNRIPSEEV